MSKAWLSLATTARSCGGAPYPHPVLPFCRHQSITPPPPPPPNAWPDAASRRHHPVMCCGAAETRRRLLSIIFPLVACPVRIAMAVEGGERKGVERLKLYTDEAEGFALLTPSSWAKVEKAGAIVLFEDQKEKGNSIGVVVNPVRLSSLRDFGTPEFVADKLVQAERRKESTKDAQVLRVAERIGFEGLPVYEFEYMVDSTRGGKKRIFSAAFVNSKKLYILNIAHSDRPENPLGTETKMVLEQILHSFDAAL